MKLLLIGFNDPLRVISVRKKPHKFIVKYYFLYFIQLVIVCFLYFSEMVQQVLYVSTFPDSASGNSDSEYTHAYTFPYGLVRSFL